MVTVTEHYEAFPYPERDPAEEGQRLVTGSPSDPVEMDHFLWGGERDWARPLRVLVAGGGTGDGLIQLAQRMAEAGRACEITYLDLSRAARATAEARAAARGLTGIRFETGSLLEAGDLGRFDYVDCCGVLHHLPDPEAGFAALRAALAPGGGLGFMVYAPLGRSGVYPLQEAFGALFAGLAPGERLARARAVLERVPEGHPFRRNPNLADHLAGDAGFYDLLLHGQDRALAVEDLLAVLGRTGWALQSFVMPGLYDLGRFAPVPEGMAPDRAMGIAERLDGTIKTHVGYAVAAGEGRPLPSAVRRPVLVPHLRGGEARALAAAVARGGPVRAQIGGARRALDLPREAAPLLAGVDGRTSLAGIARGARIAPGRAAALWSRVERALSPWGMLLYSRLGV